MTQTDAAAPAITETDESAGLTETAAGTDAAVADPRADPRAPGRPDGRRALRTGSRDWATPADVRAVLRRDWESGRALSDRLAGRAFVPVDVAVRHPSAKDVAARFDEARAWSLAWAQDATGWTTHATTIGGRQSGQNVVVARVSVESFEALVATLKVQQDVERLDRLRAATAGRLPALGEWIAANPGRALVLRPAWDRLLATVEWFVDHDARGRYLRQVDAPGVDTKFLAAHRGVLSELLDLAAPAAVVDGGAPRADLERRLGLRAKPQRVRLRFLDPAVRVGPFDDVEVSLDELAGRPLPGRNVLVVENEVTFLALPPLPDTVAVFGSGWNAPTLRGLPWLADRRLLYWGDVDTHGLAILDGLRARHPHAVSVLMDRETLLAHRAHWVEEPTQSSRAALRLTPQELALYELLRSDELGTGVRLEQERVRFGFAAERLAAAVSSG